MLGRVSLDHPILIHTLISMMFWNRGRGREGLGKAIGFGYIPTYSCASVDKRTVGPVRVTIAMGVTRGKGDSIGVLAGH